MIAKLAIIGVGLIGSSLSQALIELIAKYRQDLDRIAAAIGAADDVLLPNLFGRAKSERDLPIGNCG